MRTRKRTPKRISGIRTAGKNVKIDDSSKSKKLASTLAHKLNRRTFCTSREMDFFSAKELITQTGHEIGEWPLVFLKETIDNGLDACEEVDIVPIIDVTADACGISVKDNGPGLPEATLHSQLDFRVRASNREAYVAPDRGRQGNALKTLLPMPVVVDPEHGKLIVEAHGKRHLITCGANPISQRAEIRDDVTELRTGGTKLRIEWVSLTDSEGAVVWPFDELLPDERLRSRFLAIMEGFAIFNAHATFCLDWFGSKTMWKATNPAWEKWKPNKPTSSHWYEPQHLERLIGAYITHDRSAGTDRLVSDLVAEFDGLSGSKNRTRVLDDAGLKRVKLSELVIGDLLDSGRITKLLSAMQRHTRPVKPKRLGIISEHHLRTRLLEMGVKPESFRYARKLSKGGLPWVMESAFGWLGEGVPDDRRIYSGANWSAAIKNPFRSFGATGEGLEVTLSDLKVGAHEPVAYVLHLAHPRIEYTDRGKSSLIVGKS